MQIANRTDCLYRSVEDCFALYFPSLEANKLNEHNFMRQAEAPGYETRTRGNNTAGNMSFRVILVSLTCYPKVIGSAKLVPYMNYACCT